ncbi:hypothetical protein L916_05778 [Phytophthora nicotianae]|uniref:Uncharacterized protein n=1 Tax=Phytophthora nicotianae TaxID=4792 RepID=W2JBK4_PHYNI|nr:hypothetical protein L916_05778 [Phytophthora nicotianae]
MTAALRNISIHSNNVYLLARLIEEENALVIVLSAPMDGRASQGSMISLTDRSPMFLAAIPTQLWLELDSVNEVVALPTSKIQIARKIVASADTYSHRKILPSATPLTQGPTTSFPERFRGKK